MKYAMQLKVMLALGLLGFANMILAEIITMASPDLIHQLLLDVGIWVPSKENLLITIILIESLCGAHLLYSFWKGKMSMLNNIIGAGTALLYVLVLGKVTEGYLVFFIIECACLVSLLVLSIINYRSENKKSGFSFEGLEKESRTKEASLKSTFGPSTNY